MRAKDSLTVDRVLEWMHSDGGGFFNNGVTNNYLDNPRCNVVSFVGPPPAYGQGCSSGGTGTVNSILFQYDFSVANLLQGLRDGTTYWGEGTDFHALFYAMYNTVSSDYNAANDARATETGPDGLAVDKYSEHTKLKFGTDLQFNAFPIGGLAVRFDRLQPNDNLPEQSFSILSPRLFIRSQWITRELIIVQYSRYLYDQRVCDVATAYDPSLQNPNNTGLPANQRCAQYPSAPRQPEGWGARMIDNEPKTRGNPVAGGNPGNVRPDVNVITVAARMWW